MELTKSFVHHVFFWLKNPDSEEDLKKLHDGIQSLTVIGTIRDYHIGRPATTSREVVDGSYSYSWLTIFNTQEEQDSYQVDPIHLEFLKTCSPLWTKVVVYDSVDEAGLK